ncbi:MAG: hypothetical protein KGL16_01040 [Acidobacteriota bacterium]|nr:hypothetical protein [Acidobacteriota bacterium]
MLGVLVLGAGVAACGGSGSASAARPAQLARGDLAFLAFTRCMRHHGVQMADPYHRAGHTGLTLALPEKTPATISAYNACDHLIASVIAAKEAGMRAQQSGLSARQATARHLGLLHYARCMRSRGIPMLDPDANGNLNLGSVPGIASVGRYTPLFRRADHACRGQLPAGVADNGTGP